MSQEEPGGARRSQEEPGGARRSQEAPGGARRSQEEPGGAKRSQVGPRVDLEGLLKGFKRALKDFEWLLIKRL